MGFLCLLPWFSIRALVCLPWVSNGVPMIVQIVFHICFVLWFWNGAPMFFPWLSHGFPMICYVCLLIFQWFSLMGFLCLFSWFSIRFPVFCAWLSNGFLILFAWLSNGFQWLSYVILMVFQCFLVFSMMSDACPMSCYVMLCYIMLNRCWNHVNIHVKLIWNLCENHVKSLLKSR